MIEKWCTFCSGEGHSASSCKWGRPFVYGVRAKTPVERFVEAVKKSAKISRVWVLEYSSTWDDMPDPKFRADVLKALPKGQFSPPDWLDADWLFKIKIEDVPE